MAGDRPFARYGADASVHGQLTLGWLHAATNTTLWFHELESGYTAQYRAGEVQWIVHPVPTAAAEVTWVVVPLANDVGMVSQITVTGAAAGDRLLFMFGGAYKVPGGCSFRCIDALCLRGRHATSLSFFSIDAWPDCGFSYHVFLFWVGQRCL